MLTSSAKSKSPRLDGWTMKLLMDLFDIMGMDILAVIEDSCVTGLFSGTLNSMFLAIIPKISHTKSFNDYRLISLCNFVYTIISKIIAQTLKPVLSHDMSMK